VSSSNKRERDLARAKYERQQQRRSERQQARHKRNQVLAVVGALVLVMAAVLTIVLSTRGSDTVAEATPTDSATATASPSTSATASSAPSPTVSLPVKGCVGDPVPTTKTATYTAPTTNLSTTQTHLITFKTNCGDIVVEINPKAITTGTAVSYLADQGFYDMSDCFRLTTTGIFVLQCGSPTNDGKGGPGFLLADENLPANVPNNYPAGTVAMANSGPNTGGSQFFIVYKDTTLGPNYTIWGTVKSGLDIVKRVAEAGAVGGSDGHPNQDIVITKATTSTLPAG